MQQNIIKCTTVFQQILYSRFRPITPKAIETVLLLSLGHLFGLYNPNQLADALEIPKARLYRHLKAISLYKWKRMLRAIGCSTALAHIRETEAMSASTKSRRRITISVDDTVLSRYRQALSYCYNWWSKKFQNAIHSQNIRAITIKIGEAVIPLNTWFVGKQGCANTNKPECFVSMLKEVLAFFDAEGVSLRGYPITFDSWYGSSGLIEILSEFGFECILVHGKSNYVMTIDKTCAKLSVHKKSIQLCSSQWGCDKPVYRVYGESRTFGAMVLLLFSDGGQMRTMMVFGKRLRACEILTIWSQHHGIEQFWRFMKSNLKLSSMSLQG